MDLGCCRMIATGRRLRCLCWCRAGTEETCWHGVWGAVPARLAVARYFLTPPPVPPISSSAAGHGWRRRCLSPLSSEHAQHPRNCGPELTQPQALTRFSWPNVCTSKHTNSTEQMKTTVTNE